MIIGLLKRYFPPRIMKLSNGSTARFKTVCLRNYVIYYKSIIQVSA